MGVRNKIVGATMIGLMSLGTIASLGTSMETVKVEAASSSVAVAKSKLQKLYKSLHTNYLGIKNQRQWEAYIKDIEPILEKVSFEDAEGFKLSFKLLDACFLLNAICSINQVEKSLEVSPLVMGNVKQWEDYLKSAKSVLELVSKKEFGKEYSELANRMNKCIKIIEDIKKNYNSQYDKVYTRVMKAEETRNVEEARKAYEEARGLQECEESYELIYQCKEILEELGDIKISEDEAKVKEAFDSLISEMEDSDFEFDTTSLETFKRSIKNVVGKDIDVNVTKVYENSAEQTKAYKVVLSKGIYKTVPISINL